MSSSLPRRAPKLVAIDDDPLLRRMLERFFTEKGYTTVMVEDGITGLEAVQRERPDVVILENALPDLAGLEVLRKIFEFDRHLPVLLITAQVTSRTAIEAMKHCAFDYLPKPLALDRLEQQVERAIEARRLMRTPVQIDDGGRNEAEVDLLIGRSPAMQKVYKAVGRVAPLDVPVLIEGEPGTGKETVARVLFQSGPRAAAPFRVVHGLDFSDEAWECELFGRDGIDDSGGPPISRVGMVEQCAGGTLVLNEVGRLSLSGQSRLLRLLRDREPERIGGRRTLQPDVRCIALSSQPLEELVAEKRFRSDLYYLLRSFRIQLPPLRERTEDVPLLVDYFVKQFSRLHGAPTSEPVRVSAESLLRMTRHRWPGNLDELQSVLRRALVETNGTIVASDHLESALGSGQSTVATAGDVTDWRAFAERRMSAGSQRIYADALAEMERSLLTQVLAAARGNQARSARMLGITRGNLRKKLRALGIVPHAAQWSPAEA